MDAQTSDVMSSSAAAPTSSSVVPIPLNQGKILWPEAPSIVQNFSLPPSIIYYMAKNPSSPKVCLKMAKSCKYFFEKLPVLIVRYFFGEDMDGGFNARMCSNDKPKCEENNGKCCVKLDLKKLSSQIWLTNSVEIKNDITSVLCKKIYRCESSFLSLHDHAVIFDDFKVLATTAYCVYLEKCLIEYNDGKHVILDKIVEIMNKIMLLRYDFPDTISVATPSTLKNIMKLSNFKKFSYIQLINIPQIFAVEDLSAFIKKFRGISLFFNSSIFQEYKNQLDNLTDEIIELQLPNRIIRYDDQDPLKFLIMFHMESILLNNEDDDSYEADDEGEEEDDAESDGGEDSDQ